MSLNFKSLMKLSIVIMTTLFLLSCSSEETAPVEPEKKTGTLTVSVLNEENSARISNANVVLYNADNNEAISRKSSDSNGECSFECEPGNYFARIAAQGYQPSPPKNNSPIKAYEIFI